MVYRILHYHHRRRYGTTITWQRPHDSGSPSSDTASSSALKCTGCAVRHPSENRGHVEKRSFVHDAPMGPKQPRSTVLSPDQEAACVAFRTHTLLSLDDCLYALQATIPGLTRSSLHRCFQRHGISRLPDVSGDKPDKKFKPYPIGYFHIDIAEVRTEAGKLYLFVAIDRTSKFAYAELVE